MGRSRGTELMYHVAYTVQVFLVPATTPKFPRQASLAIKALDNTWILFLFLTSAVYI